ncbi:hypothetical protein CSUNSWCD_2215 [Campylobacter showae CSUNSWCD]|uniref:Uncharacterized protein n=1 Tax=Campylobacter showae CSUNSWCD TaxID=1244083 RepID=M5IFB2_9BACT|nr:hypothetical protein CSUNSWCD_2215 [Campylobacter showae CSUNSWCD]
MDQIRLSRNDDFDKLDLAAAPILNFTRRHIRQIRRYIELNFTRAKFKLQVKFGGRV